MSEKIYLIEERTAREWPADHPLRRAVAGVIPYGASLPRNTGAFLICARAGEERIPPAADDADESCACCSCATALLRRRSARRDLAPICQGCWESL